MANRDFTTWLSNFRESIADYGYYIDFEKVHRNVGEIKVELNILNSLIGSKNIERDFENLMKGYPQILKCIPLLLAVRSNEVYCQDENGGHLYKFDLGKYPPNSHKHYYGCERKQALGDDDITARVYIFDEIEFATDLGLDDVKNVDDEFDEIDLSNLEDFGKYGYHGILDVNPTMVFEHMLTKYLSSVYKIVFEDLL